MRSTTYTVIIEQGFRIVREFAKPETVIDIAAALFGEETASEVEKWLGCTIEGTYSNKKGLRIYKILNL